jgi:hypothetical protein
MEESVLESIWQQVRECFDIVLGFQPAELRPLTSYGVG